MDGEITEVVEVVTYDDAAALAADAAAAALESQGVDTSAEVGAVAESAAADAIDAAAAEIDARVDAAAAAAADAAVSGVQDRLDATLAAIEDRSADLESAVVEVTITADQYDALMTQLRVIAGAGFLTLCVTSALLGALVWNTVCRGFR